MSRSSPCTFSRFLTNSPPNWPSSSRSRSASSEVREGPCRSPQALDGRLDRLRLLRLGERDDADALAGLLLQQLADQLGDVLRLPPRSAGCDRRRASTRWELTARSSRLSAIAACAASASALARSTISGSALSGLRSGTVSSSPA